MRNKRIWIIGSFICIIAGFIILGAGRMLGGQPGFYIDRRGIHPAGEPAAAMYEIPIQNSKDLEFFDRMEIHVDYADVELVASDRFAVDYCITGEYGAPVCEVRNGRFTFREAESFKFFNVGFFTGSLGVALNTPEYYVRIEIPSDQKLSEAFFDIDSGNLDITALQADTLKIENEYGDVNISNAKGGRLTLNMDSCNCQINRMEFTNVSIKNEYGDISLGLPGEIDSYGLNLYTEYGDIRIENQKQGYDNDDYETSYQATGNGKNQIDASCESGNIEIYSVK